MISLQVRKKDLAVPLNVPNDKTILTNNIKTKPGKPHPEQVKSLLVRKYSNKDKLDVWFKFISTSSTNSLVFYTNTLRALWGDLYGTNKSGSPKQFSSLMDRINTNKAVNGWVVYRVSEDTKDIKDANWEFYKVLTSQKIIYIRTSNMNSFVGGFLNTGYHANGCAKKVTTYWDLAKGKRDKFSPVSGWFVKAL